MIKIQKALRNSRRNILQLVSAITLVLLLCNAYLYKDLHYLVELGHDHTHHHDHNHGHSHIDHSDCPDTAHFHSYQIQGQCLICGFNFSPQEFSKQFVQQSTTLRLSNRYSFSYNSWASNFYDLLPGTRGPPIFIV